MKRIKLTQGKFAIVDDEDFEFLNQWKWFYSNGYAMRNKEDKTGLIRLHRVINQTPKGFLTDHINRNKLDNRKSNLRSVTKSQNEHNTIARKNSKSGIKNVIWENRRNRWRVEMMVNKEKIFLGYFSSLKEATLAQIKGELLYASI